MKKNKAIIFGILILIAGIGLLFYAIMPELIIFTVPIWKWILAGAILYWLIKKVVFGKSLAYRLSVFLPLGLAFVLFEKEIGTLIGKGSDFVNNGLVIAAAVLLDVAIMMIFRTRNKKFFSASNKNGETKVTTGDSKVESVNFKLGSHIYYVDASVQTEVNVVNQVSELKVYYQNTDTGDTSGDLYFNIVNQMGETKIFIPKNWHVELNSDCAMGAVNCRPDGDVLTRTIYIRVKNQMGEVDIISED